LCRLIQNIESRIGRKSSFGGENISGILGLREILTTEFLETFNHDLHPGCERCVPNPKPPSLRPPGLLPVLGKCGDCRWVHKGL
jgi:hypothetical protein